MTQFFKNSSPHGATTIAVKYPEDTQLSDQP